MRAVAPIQVDLSQRATRERAVGHRDPPEVEVVAVPDDVVGGSVAEVACGLVDHIARPDDGAQGQRLFAQQGQHGPSLPEQGATTLLHYFLLPCFPTSLLPYFPTSLLHDKIEDRGRGQGG